MRWRQFFQRGSQPKPRRTSLNVESLEGREMPAALTSYEVAGLQIVNQLRANPATFANDLKSLYQGGSYTSPTGYAASDPVWTDLRADINYAEAHSTWRSGFNSTGSNTFLSVASALPARSPIAWDSAMQDGSIGHNQWMYANVYAHSVFTQGAAPVILESPSNPIPGITRNFNVTVGDYFNYIGLGLNSAGENISYGYNQGGAIYQAYRNGQLSLDGYYQRLVYEDVVGFMLEYSNGSTSSPWGHLQNLTGAYNVVGLASMLYENPVESHIDGVAESYFATERFGNRSGASYGNILVYQDLNNNNVYDAGEGLAAQLTYNFGGGALTLTNTGSSSIAIPSTGTYTVSATYQGAPLGSQQIVANGANQTIAFKVGATLPPVPDVNNGALVSDIIAGAPSVGSSNGIAITGLTTTAGSFAPVTDDFNRGSLGTNYTVQSGPGFSFNGSTATPTGFTVATLNGLTQANVAVQVNVALGGPGSFLGVVARYAGSGDNNLYLGTLVNNGGVVSADIWKNVGGSYTRLTTTPVASGTALLRLEILGSTLRLLVDGVVKGQISDTGLAAAGKVGLRGAGGSYDNFRVEPMSATAFDISMTDDFNRATLGAGYTLQTGAAITLNGAIAAAPAFSVVTLDSTPQANIAVEANVTLNGPGSFMGVVARYSGSGDNNLYLGTLVNNGGVVSADIWKNVGGAYTRLTSTPVASGAGLLRLEVLGPSLRILVDGVVKGQIFDTGIGAAGLAGLRGSNATFDNFKVEQAPLGTFQFTIDNGTTWTPIAAASDSNALLLAADANTRVRFVANPGAAVAPIAPSLLFRAWDRTSGTNGAVANVSVNGAGTAFSAATGTAVQSVPFLDNFNNAFASGWQTQVAGLTVANNQVQSTTPLGVSTYAVVRAADVAVEAAVSVRNNDTFAGLLARYSGPGDNNTYAGFLVGRGGQFVAEIWKNVAGGWTRLTTAAAPSGTGVLRLEAFGNTLKLSLNGALLGLTQDNSITSAGGVGIRMSNGAATVDAFTATTLLSLPGFTDNFNRANSAALGSTYSELVDDASIASNAVKVNNYSLVTLPGVQLADVRAAVDIALTPDGGPTQSVFAGLGVRSSSVSDSNMYWACIVLRNGLYTVELWKAAPNFGSGPIASAPLATGTGRLQIEAQAASLRVSIDGVLKLSLTDTSLTAPGAISLRAFKATLDNLSIDSI